MEKPRLSAQEIKRFRAIVYSHFKQHGREFPWRIDYHPYHVMVSEIMLQQTQADRIALKFPAFIAAFPDFSVLARSPFSTVLALWQGLGYNRRARNLKRCAEMVVERYHGTLPCSPETLATLPGIGAATAASICAFAFNKPAVFLETNIRTALIHHFFSDRTRVSDEELWPIAQAALDQKNPRRWYSALMDYGSMLKKQYGNASRRSTEYKTQTKFQGSRRQIRGTLLRLLLAQGPCTFARLQKQTRCRAGLLREVLGELVREGMVSQNRTCFTIPA